MTAKAEGAEKFPSFNGKDLDGNDVNSDELSLVRRVEGIVEELRTLSLRHAVL